MGSGTNSRAHGHPQKGRRYVRDPVKISFAFGGAACLRGALKIALQFHLVRVVVHFIRFPWRVILHWPAPNAARKAISFSRAAGTHFGRATEYSATNSEVLLGADPVEGLGRGGRSQIFECAIARN